MKFTAFVINTIHITVTRTESHCGNIQYCSSLKIFGCVNTFILMSPKYITISAAIICIANFSLAFRFLQSSTIPITTIIAAPHSVAISCLLNPTLKHKTETRNPHIIARPPKRGIGFLCIRLLSRGTSMAPIFIASRFTSGVDANENTNDTTNAQKRYNI